MDEKTRVLRTMEMGGRLSSFLTEEEKQIIYSRWLKDNATAEKIALQKTITAAQERIDKIAADEVIANGIQ